MAYGVLGLMDAHTSSPTPDAPGGLGLVRGDDAVLGSAWSDRGAGSSDRIDDASRLDVAAPPAIERIPALLRRYVVAVAVFGPIMAVAVAVADFETPTRAGLLRASLLTALAVLGNRFPLQLTHKTVINVTTAAHVAMILVFPPGVAGLLAVVAVAIAHLSRRRDRIETLFNVGQTALAVTLAAICFEATRDLAGLGPRVGDFGGLGAVALAAAVLHLANTALVAGAGALQVGADPPRTWVRGLATDLPAEAALVALGVVAAYLVEDHPLALPILALPATLVHHALRQTVRLRTDTHRALAALVEVVELRDPYTAGHSQRVAATARALALRLGLTAEEADTIETAGRVHDVGKVALDPGVLVKVGGLTEGEWVEMRRHPALGADVVARFAAYGVGHLLVRHHHERWDGAGYPDGLAGEAIPLGARILAVADAHDAMTSARPYRSAMSAEASMRILAEGAGTQWDPRVVGAMRAHLAAAGEAPVPVRLTAVPA